MDSYVQIPKDLKKVKTKVAFNLTKRQLIGFSVAAIIGFPLYLYTRKPLGNEVAMLILIVVTMPAFFITFYEKDGLTAEKYLKCMYLHNNYQPKIRVSKKLIKKRKGDEYESKNKKPRKKTQKKGDRSKTDKKRHQNYRKA